jgi:hypothetical protein
MFSTVDYYKHYKQFVHIEKKSLFDIIFDVLTAVTMKIIVLLDVTPCSPVEYYRYSG